MPEQNPVPGAALEDLLVLELGDEGTQYCGKLLADMGAQVIKVEPPEGAGARHRGPFAEYKPDPNGSLYFWAWNTSKRSVVLDLRSARDRAKLKRLVRLADVVLEDFQPGHLDQLRLGYAHLRRLNPRLVMTSVTSFGQTGPLAHWKGSDLVHWAMAGNMWLIGYDDPATPPLCPQGDHSYLIAGHWACIGTLAALWERDSTGAGQHVDVSAHEAGSFATEWSVPELEYLGTHTRRHDYLGGAIRCKDGRYFIPQMVNIGPDRWSRFVDWLKQLGVGQHLYEDKFFDPDVLRTHLHVVLDVIRGIAATKTADEMWVEGQRLGFTWVIFNAPEELLSDEQLLYRKFFQTVDHPERGQAYQYAGPPYEWSDAPWHISRRPPLLGEHNAMLAELLQRSKGAL